MKALIILICAIFVQVCCSQIQQAPNIFNIFKSKKDPDCLRNVSQLISSKGYPVENHVVQTLDGYLLTIQRIPYGRKKSSFSMNKPVVFLQHGLLASASDWVINFANQSLGFILADKGYDVWLGNIRGNTYSRKHINYTINMKQFWNFSFDEMAEYDLPAMIDFILNKTGQKQLFYVGHSQGTTCAFALLSRKPEYNKKIKLLVALAPVATVGYITSAIRYLAPLSWEIDFLFKELGVYDFLPNNRIMKFLSAHVCNTRLKFLCEKIIFLVCGTDYGQLNETRLEVYTSHSPAGTSTKSVIHYAQMVDSKKFQMFDYGHKNEHYYNMSSPPQYYVENITTPTVLFWSENDKLADRHDVLLLKSKLKSLVACYQVHCPSFNHLDFVWGINATGCVYQQVMTLFKKYSFLSNNIF